MSEFHRPTVRALMDLFSIEGCNFYHNEPNNYGAITGTIFTGRGPADNFRGKEHTAKFAGGQVRGTGYFKLNEAGINRIMWLLEEHAKFNAQFQEPTHTVSGTQD